ncbi:hypothetical protein ACFW0P_06060 [Lysobacter soli]|uniref:hypothetical protein n=1 Tax=Lysobacter soli TaxID=453783 RepID=UPI0036C57FBD
MDEPKIDLNARNAFAARHGAGALKLEGGTGPITRSVNMGDWLEVYKADMTYRIQSPESIDPHETNPNAPWVVTPAAQVGSSNPTVARVLLQSEEIIDAAMLVERIDKDAVMLVLHGLKEAILTCEAISSKVCDRIDSVIAAVLDDGIARDTMAVV